MCRYSYVYFSKCQHGELTRLSYCDTAKALGLPEKHDRLRTKAKRTDEGEDDKGNKHQVSSSSPEATPDKPSSASECSRPSSQPTSPESERSPHTEIMSTAMPSEVVPARSWAQAASSPVEDRFPSAERIPRSVQSQFDAAASIEQPAGSDTHHHVSQASSSLGTTDYDNLNISIPLQPYSGFSMKLTHDNGKVQEIVTRFESLGFRDRPKSDGPLSDDIRVSADTASTRATSASSVETFEPDTDTDTIRGFPIGRGGSSTGHPPHTTPGLSSDIDHPSSPAVTVDPSRAVHAEGKHTLSRKLAKEMGKLTDTNITNNIDTEDSEAQSPRKPIPARWTGKTQGPSLATAQRAMARESRKQASQDLTATAGRKTVRAAHGPVESPKFHGADSTMFLTKTTVEAVESDLTATNTLNRTASTIRQSTSKATLKEPGGSPVRGSPKRDSTIASPRRPAWGSVHNFDGSGHSLTVDDGRKQPHPPSSVSSVGGFVAARQSPVSQGSPHSFETAPYELQDDVSEFDLTNADDYVQKTSRSTGMKSHSRGKSEPQVKVSPLGRATTTKPMAPTLSLRIPHPSSQSTDRKTPLTAGSASSSGSGTPASPASSSRIPRISSSAKGESSQLTRSRSTKSLPSKATAVKGSQHREPDGMHSLEPAAIPLPATPAAPNLRQVRTLNSEGATPILSCGHHPKAVSSSLTSSNLSQLGTTPGTPATPTDQPSVKADQADPGSVMVIEEASSMPVSEEIGMLCPSDAVDVLFLDGSTDTKDEVRTAADHVPDDDVETNEARGRLQRVASWASETTVKAAQRDPVLDDTAVIYSRKKSGSTGMDASTGPIAGTMAHSAESVRVLRAYTGPTISSSAGGVGLQQTDVYDRRKTPSESSLLFSLTSGLRPEAAEFVPQQRPDTGYPSTMPLPQQATDYRPPVPTEWMNPHELQYQAPEPPSVPFDPFGLDTYGRPLYHLMYPVPVGPGTPYDFSKYRTYNHSPKKGKKKRYEGRSRRGQQSHSDITSSSPTKAYPTENLNTAASEGGEDETTPRPAAAVPVRNVLPTSEGNPTASASHEGPHDPFRTQMEEITNQAAALSMDCTAPTENAEGGNVGLQTVGRGPSMPAPENAPFRPQYSGFEAQPPLGPRGGRVYDEGLTAHGVPYPDFNSLPTSYRGDRNRHRYSNSRSDMYASYGNGLYEGRGPRSFRNRNWNASAGVPLEATAPFPNPVAPPGPQRTVEQAGPSAECANSKEYVGYTIVKREKKTCGQMIIDPAMEWHGQLCNKCDSKQ